VPLADRPGAPPRSLANRCSKTMQATRPPHFSSALRALQQPGHAHAYAHARHPLPHPPRLLPSLLLRVPSQRRAFSVTGVAASASAATPSLLTARNIPAPHTGTIRILSLNRPAARNAISRQLLAELARETQQIHAEAGAGPTRALILASEVDASFCAGADLKERATFTQEQ